MFICINLIFYQKFHSPQQSSPDYASQGNFLIFFSFDAVLELRDQYCEPVNRF